jgi:hypothetical protein
MTTEFKVGDRVCYSSMFLKNVGWHTDVPDYGQVIHVHGKIVEVLWCDERDTRTLCTNLILESEKHLEPV